MYSNQYKGIWFMEGDDKNAVIIEDIKIELNGVFSQSQLKTLNDVKDQMVRVAQVKQCNAVINFKYGQKSSFLKSILGLDDVYWYGSGQLARLENPPV